MLLHRKPCQPCVQAADALGRRAALQVQKGTQTRSVSAQAPAGRPVPPGAKALPTSSLRPVNNGEMSTADDAEAEIRRLQGEVDRLSRELAARIAPGP